MAGFVYQTEGTTRDGKKVKLTVSLKKFCKCKSSHLKCEEDIKPILERKLNEILSKESFENLFWLDGKVHPNFYVKIMEAVTEAMETICVTARSDHLQGAQVSLEAL